MGGDNRRSRAGGNLDRPSHYHGPLTLSLSKGHPELVEGPP